jgi:hypothetical protein
MLKEQVREYEDTFSAWDAVLEFLLTPPNKPDNLLAEFVEVN